MGKIIPNASKFWGWIITLIFSIKKPIITYAIIAICVIVFILMGGATDGKTLLAFGANLGLLGKQGEIYMVVFNQPYSQRLIVKTPKNTSIIEASVLTTGEEVKVTETAKNEYNVSVPMQNPGEPYVIKLKMKYGKGTNGEYRDALT